MLKKISLALAGLLLGALALGQVSAPSPVVGQNPAILRHSSSIWNDPYIRIPKSTMPQRRGFRSTHYVINVAPSQFRPNGQINPNVPKPAQTPDGFWPSQIHTAYNITPGLGTKAIAIAIAFDNPTALSDFNTFSSQFGLPVETSTNALASSNQHFQVVYASGSQPSTDSGWAGEGELDMEWTHAMAPNAKIYLVEGTDNSDQGLFGAVTVARSLPNVKQISMSWGGGEFSDELSLDSTFNNSGIVYFASAGDTGGEQEYPSESPYVVGVGGTTLVLDNNNKVVSETAWNGSGGGPSSFEPRPTYQNIVASIVGAVRGTPDIAAVADPNTGVAVYGQTGFGGWAVVGGTSVACPLSAGVANARGQFSPDPTSEHNRIYNTIFANSTLWKKLYRDVVSGTAGSFSAEVGWDFITGIGAPAGMFPLADGVSSAPTNATLIEGVELPVGNPFNLETVFDAGPYGETAATSVDFVLTQPVANYATGTITAALTTPLRATSQIFIWNPSTSKYEIVVSAPGTGIPTTMSKDITNLLASHAFTHGGNTILRFAYRGIGPARSFSGPFVFRIGTSSFTGFLNQ